MNTRTLWLIAGIAACLVTATTAAQVPHTLGYAGHLENDDGEVDGDTEWDRAVGPMQFIPETWSRRGVDGNDDGTVDPQNVYDAAAAAAGLLCEGDLHLATPAGRHEALLAYNTSDAYVDEVQNHARRYRSLMLPRRAAGNADSP